MKRFLHRVASFVTWHRRVFGALLAAAAVWLAVEAASAEPPTTPAVVVAADVPPGHRITEADLNTIDVPEHVGLSSMSADEAVGQITATRLAAGTVVQPGLFTGASSVEEGRAVVPISIGDHQLRSLLQPGDRITLVMLNAESAEVLTNDARVSALPSPDTPGSALGAATSTSSVMILVDVQADEAPVVAALGQAQQLSIVLGEL